ncbi:MAG: VWA domain-containing protein [Deltaproteobacteria bacterium]|jgi:uncharacterized protein YegL|nr:VWA domain-containing protein [Deltaproteobacteria bacterium]
MYRRLPVYLLLDTSESMAGEPLDRVEAGVATMVNSLKRNPYALDTVHMCVITFDAKARVVTPLTDIGNVKPPILSIKPGTSLGAALDLLGQSIEKNLVKNTAETKGDYKPLVFILTDGQPTDDWTSAVSKLKNVTPHVATIYGIGCGDEVDFETLSKIADVCFHVKDLNSDGIGKLFVWLTASVQSNSKSPDQKVSLEKTIPLEKGMELVESPPAFSGQKSRLFIHIFCRNTKKPYMVIYRLIPELGQYFSDQALPLPDDFFSDGAKKSSPINEEQLLNVPPCPFCQSEGFAKCGFCKNLFCVDSDSSDSVITCPACETKLSPSESGGSINIDGSAG